MYALIEWHAMTPTLIIGETEDAIRAAAYDRISQGVDLPLPLALNGEPATLARWFDDLADAPGADITFTILAPEAIVHA